MATKSISQLDSAVSLALGDLFEIAEPDAQSQTGYASKKISLSQEAAFIQENVESQNLNTTSKTLVGAINEVDSEGVKWSEYNVLGAKNLNSFPYNESTTTKQNVLFTVYNDGSINANGQSSASSESRTGFNCHLRGIGSKNPLFLKNGTYILSGCPSGGTNSTYYLAIGRTVNGAFTEYGRDYGEGLQFTVNGDDNNQDKAQIQLIFYISGQYTADNLLAKPMIRLASITDNKWMPYAESNRNLTIGKLEASEIATVENTDNASQAYTIGDYMIWKGGFYKVISAISSGGAITEGTNVTQTTIGAELKAALNA